MRQRWESDIGVPRGSHVRGENGEESMLQESPKKENQDGGQEGAGCLLVSRGSQVGTDMSWCHEDSWTWGPEWVLGYKKRGVV